MFWRDMRDFRHVEVSICKCDVGHASPGKNISLFLSCLNTIIKKVIWKVSDVFSHPDNFKTVLLVSFLGRGEKMEKQSNEWETECLEKIRAG